MANSYKGGLVAPFSLYSSSVSTGYARNLSQSFKEGVDITNYHRDGVETGLQGPFTETHVGGLQYRHQNINLGDDDENSRAEGFRVITGGGSLQIRSSPTSYPRANLYREERAKRPVNIGNIKTNTASAGLPVGNYTHDYEITQISGRTLNNPGLCTFIEAATAASTFPELHTHSNAVSDPNGNESIAVAFGTDGWQFTGSGTGVATYTSQSYAGTYAIEVTLTNTGSVGLYYEFPTSIGKVYDISIWARRGASGSDQVFRDWVGFDESVDTPITSTTYSEYTFSLTANASSGSIIVWAAEPTGTVGDSVIFDNISVMREAEAVIPGSKNTIPFISGAGANYLLCAREPNRHVFVERFGSLTPESESPIGLDYEAEEYSSYNALPWRNYVQRYGGGYNALAVQPTIVQTEAPLIKLLASHSGQYGINKDDSVSSLDYNTDAAYHKINRNRKQIIDLDSFTFGSEVHTQANAASDPNGNEANATTGWTDLNNSTIVSLGGSPFAGSYYLCMLNTSAGGATMGYTFSSVPGKRYRISLAAYYNLSGPDIGQEWKFSDWDGILEDVDTNITNENPDWGRYIFDVTATHTSITAKFVITDGNGGLENAICVDDVSIKEITGETRDQFDNWFVQHAIPRRDTQYSWISSSYSSAPYDYAVDSDDITYYTGSEVDLYNTSTGLPTSSFVPHVPFALWTAEPVSSSANTVGFADPFRLFAVGSYKYPIFANREFATTRALGTTDVTGHAEWYHALYSSRWGNGGWSTWKQVRMADDPLVEYHRKNNIISNLERRRATSFVSSRGFFLNINPLKEDRIVQYEESPVSTVSYPIIHTFDVGDENDYLPVMMYDYENNIKYFSNERLNNTLGLKKPDSQMYDNVTSLYLGDTRILGRKPIQDLISIAYKQRIYPIDKFEGFGRIRNRENFIIHWWNDEREDRRRVDGLNSFGTITSTYAKGYSITDQKFISTHSVWPLDPRENFSTTSGYDHTYDTASAATEGEFFQRATIFMSGTSPSFRRRNYFHAQVYAPRRVHASASATSITFGGDTYWDAPEQAGKNPYYHKSYEDFAQHVRLVGRDHSLIPEFKISEHMNFYLVDKGGDFLAKNSEFLTLSGSNISDSSMDDFIETYTDSNFLKHFEIIEDDHKDIKGDRTVTLKCSAVKKLNVLDDFYPMKRLQSVGQLFSQSYADNIDGWNFNIDTKRTPRPILTAMMAPGIIYNTVKAGLAVDFPIFTKVAVNPTFTVVRDYGITGSVLSENSSTGTTRTADTSIPRISEDFDERLPFETILNPERYLTPEKRIIDLWAAEPASRTSAWRIDPPPFLISANEDDFNLLRKAKDIRYSLAMHNFLAESINVFLRKKRTTTIISKFDDEEDFGLADPNKVYQMQLELYKEPTFLMYKNGYAFGPAVDASHVRQLGSAEYTGSGYAPFTPPYFAGGEIQDPNSFSTNVERLQGATATIKFTPYKTDSNKYTLDEILSNLEISYNRLTMADDDWSWVTADESFNSSAETLSSSVSPSPNLRNAMQISASFSLLNSVNKQDPEFNAISTVPSTIKSKDSKAWVIQSKFETPILDFSDYTNYNDVTLPGISARAGGDYSVNVGMWHQYGSIPEEGKGINIKVGAGQITDFINTSSLADLVGFDSRTYPVGVIANESLLREAVISIPYKFENQSKKMIPLTREQVDIALGLSEGDIPEVVQDMVDKMQRYYLPPRFDFITNRDIRPFFMYIFEFEQALSKQELADIWQNLPPSCVDSFSTEEKSVSHTYEDLGITSLKDYKWMVFKVKQRGEKNYFKKIAGASADERFTFDFNFGDGTKTGFTPDYSYNWPHDFYSLVELAKIDAEVEIEKDEE